MKNWLKEFRSELRERLLNFTWRQWAHLGISSAFKENPDNWCIDPEALALFTFSIARSHPRLFDETMDWLMVNARFVNMPRMKTLTRKFDFTSTSIAAAVMETAGETDSRLSWQWEAPVSDSEAKSLFIKPNGEFMESYGKTDEIFKKHGFLRGEVELRGISRRFNPVKPECTLLRLRSLFGITARPEIMLYLLTHKAAHPSGIAGDTGFSQKNVQDALVDMAASGIVHCGELVGRKKMYFVPSQARYPFIHDPDTHPQWVAWPALLRGLELLWCAIDDLGMFQGSTDLLTVEFRKIYQKAQPLLQTAGYGHFFPRKDAFTEEDFVMEFKKALFAGLDELGALPASVP